jgi:hypothetical protein
LREAILSVKAEFWAIRGIFALTDALVFLEGKVWSRYFKTGFGVEGSVFEVILCSLFHAYSQKDSDSRKLFSLKALF